MADTETRVVYGQPPSEVDHARELLGLSDTEAKLLPHLPRGQALWKVGTRSFLVDHRLSEAEAALVDTDGRVKAGNPVLVAEYRAPDAVSECLELDTHFGPLPLLDGAGRSLGPRTPRHRQGLKSRPGSTCHDGACPKAGAPSPTSPGSVLSPSRLRSTIHGGRVDDVSPYTREQWPISPSASRRRRAGPKAMVVQIVGEIAI